MKYPMTEEVAKSERTLPQSLTSLRQKLGQKAKQTVHASGESLQESRMREIRTSGLRRGREISSLPTLPSLREIFTFYECINFKVLSRNISRIFSGKTIN